MAWTVSAAERRDFADTQSDSASWSNPSALIISLGGGELHRGLCIVFAAFLTLAGTAAAHLPPFAMATFLFVAGAALALATFPISHQSPAEPTAPSWQAQTASRFQELTAPAMRGTAENRDQWATLTAHMSHELRTPLNAVIGFSELMAQEAFGPLGSSQYGAYAKDIHASGKSLLKAAEDALAITAILTAQQAPAQRSVVNLASLVDEACEFWNSDLNKTAAALTLDIPASLDVSVDAQMARQLIINLLYDAKQRATSVSKLAITALLENNDVILTLHLAPSADRLEPATSTFGLKMATTLSELIDSELDCGVCGAGTWQARVRFRQNSQADFFA